MTEICTELVDCKGRKVAKLQVSRRGEYIEIKSEGLEGKEWEYQILDESQRGYEVLIK